MYLENMIEETLDAVFGQIKPSHILGYGFAGTSRDLTVEINDSGHAKVQLESGYRGATAR